MADKTRPVPVKDLKKGDVVLLMGGRHKVTGVTVQIHVAEGQPISGPLNLMVDVVVPDEEDLCPNGQDGTECREIDPCEMCWQDQQDEGDEIEESMDIRR